MFILALAAIQIDGASRSPKPLNRLPVVASKRVDLGETILCLTQGKDRMLVAGLAGAYAILDASLARRRTVPSPPVNRLAARTDGTLLAQINDAVDLLNPVTGARTSLLRERDTFTPTFFYALAPTGESFARGEEGQPVEFYRVSGGKASKVSTGPVLNYLNNLTLRDDRFAFAQERSVSLGFVRDPNGAKKIEVPGLPASLVEDQGGHGTFVVGSDWITYVPREGDNMHRARLPFNFRDWAQQAVWVPAIHALCVLGSERGVTVSRDLHVLSEFHLPKLPAQRYPGSLVASASEGFVFFVAGRWIYRIELSPRL